MRQLVYISKRSSQNQDLAALLRTSQRNNARQDITGMLLCSKQQFMQALEGPESAVEQTLERIQADPRHTGLCVLLDQTIHTRDFGAWSMGLHELSPADRARFPDWQAIFDYELNPAKIEASPGLALHMLRMFAQGYEPV